MAKKANGVYALYKGDNWIWDGTLEELAAYTNKTVANLKYLRCPSVKNRNESQPKSSVLVLIEDCE